MSRTAETVARGEIRPIHAAVVGTVSIAPLLLGVSPVERSVPNTIFHLLGLALLLTWLVPLVRTGEWRGLGDRLLRWPMLLLLAYVGWTALGSHFSATPAPSRLATLDLAVGTLICAVIAAEFRSRRQVRLLLGCLFAGIILLALAALGMSGKRLDMLSGAFHDRQLFALFLCLVLPVALGAASGTEDRVWRIIAQCATAVALICLVVSQNRSAWLGVLVGGIIFVGLSVAYSWSLSSLAKVRRELLVTGLLLVLLVGMFLGVTRSNAGVAMRAATLQKLQGDSSLGWRVEMWRVGLRLTGDRPLLGWGPGSFPYAQQRLNPASRSAESIQRTGPSLTEDPHNAYVRIAAEQGVIGLLLFLGVIAAFLIHAVRALPRMQARFRKHILIGCIASVAAGAVTVVGNPGWAYPEIAAYFWTVMGLGLAASGWGQAMARAKQPEAQGWLPFSPRVLTTGRRVAVTMAAGVVGCTLLGVDLVPGAMAQVIVPIGGGQIPLYVTQGFGERGDRGVETALITAAVPSAAAAAVPALLGAAGAPAGFTVCDPCACVDELPALPADHTDLTDVRLVPSRSTLDRGECRCFFLHVRSGKDNKWYSVTLRPESTFHVAEGEQWVQQANGRRSVFCVPMDVAPEAHGQKAIIVGTFARSGSAPMAARAEVTIKLRDAQQATLPDDHRAITDIRLRPEKGKLDPGCCTALTLEVRSAKDGEWYRVTRHQQSQFRVRAPHELLMSHTRGPGIFCLPPEAPDQWDHTEAVVEGTFTPPEGEPRTAVARLRIELSGERLPALPSGHQRVLKARLAPEKGRVRVGCCVRFYLEVQSALDRKWYSVSQRPESLFYPRNEDDRVVQSPEQKSRYCVRTHRTERHKSRRVEFVGVFAPEGQPSVTATASIRIVGSGIALFEEMHGGMDHSAGH
ncbi:MAG: O-antigen ligase family protein [Armatimonadota bacterium]